jgi:hypothetical protein
LVVALLVAVGLPAFLRPYLALQVLALFPVRPAVPLLLDDLWLVDRFA